MGDNVRLRHFGDCARLVRDTCNPTDVPPLTPYIGLEHIPENDLHLSDYGFAGDVASTKTKFKKEDILFGKLRPYFRKVIIAPFDGVCSTDIWVVRAKKEVDQKYLFYWMASHEFVDQATQGSEGTKMPRAKWEYISRFEQPVPSLPEQHFIAEVLGALDDKIELNRRMNTTLESMAKAVFKAWFVENEEAKGWKVGSILEFAELLSGGTPSTQVAEYWNGDIKWVSAKDVGNAQGTFVLDTERKITHAGVEHSSTKILPELTTIVTARGTVGSYCILDESMAINQTNYGLKAKEKDADYFVFFSLANLVVQLRQAAYGTIFDTVTTRTFETSEVVIPPVSEIAKFNQQVQPMMEMILSNLRQSRTLAALRDALLPRLMSGEVRVSVDG